MFNQNKFFRDMAKNPDMYPDDLEEKAKIKAIVLEESNQVVVKNTKMKSFESENKRDLFTPAGEDFIKTVELVRSADLLPEFKDNAEELKLIEKRRDLILNYLANILEDVKSYLSQINYLQLQKLADYEDMSKYQEAIGPSDALRRSYHNKLISDIKIAMRLININYNLDFPESLRLKQEAMMPEREGVSSEHLQELMRQHKYEKFPHAAGVFIDFAKAPKDPSAERLYIASWALRIYADLTKLSNRIKE